MILWLKHITFANPTFLLGLLLIPLLIGYYIWRRKKLYGTVTVSTISSFGEISKRNYVKSIPNIIKLIGLGFLIVALARPQSSLNWQDTSNEGIDIVISLDVSGSMLAEDFRPNRLEAAKEVAMNFVSDRQTDRIGLVIYAAESFTQCPLTTDHTVLLNLFKDVKNGLLEDGTAVGNGLATSVNRLRNSEAKSKVIILLTDGSSNSGSIPPISAAEIAKEFGIRVYTIGVGKNGTARTPYRDVFGRTVYQNVPVRIDEKVLKEIAEITGGDYFRATGNKSLKKVYEQIDKLEKSKIEVTEYRQKSEEFVWFAGIAAILFLIAFILNHTIFRTIV